MTNNDLPVDCRISLDSQQHHDDDNMISDDDNCVLIGNPWQIHFDLNSLQRNGIPSLFVNYSYSSQTCSTN